MQRNYGANGPLHYSISALAPSPHSLSFSLFTFTYCSVLVPKGEKSFLISSALFFTHLGPVFFFFFFAEAGSHFISLIISLSTTSHKGISNKYFLPFVVGLFFRSASYSPIFYIPSASLPCKVQPWLYNKYLWDPVSDIKLSFWIEKPIEIFHPNGPPSKVMSLFKLES